MCIRDSVRAVAGLRHESPAIHEGDTSRTVESPTHGGDRGFGGTLTGYQCDDRRDEQTNQEALVQLHPLPELVLHPSQDAAMFPLHMVGVNGLSGPYGHPA